MNFEPGTRIRVKPVVFYPKEVAGNASWVSLWRKFHVAAREKYRLLLKGRDTFELVDPPITFNGELTAQTYKDLCFTFDGLKDPSEVAADQCGNGVDTILAEILFSDFDNGKRYTRYTLPYCLSILLIDPLGEWNAGWGRNLNGAYDLGGGFLVISSAFIDQSKLMSTLIHELGHTFGLVHITDRAGNNDLSVDSSIYKCYYDPFKSNSIMSYNIANHTNSIDPAQIPGCLLGDEIEALSRNKLVFPDLFFDPNNDFDCPPDQPGCPPHDKMVRREPLGPMNMFFCTTGFEMPIEGSEIQNLNDQPGRWILSSHPAIGFVGARMWQSSVANKSGWVSFKVTFPIFVSLNRLIIYTEHSGKYNKAEIVQIERQNSNGTFSFVERQATPEPDTEIEFSGIETQVLKLALKAGDSNTVTVRGIRFFRDDDELFPPLGPHARTDYGEAYGSKVSNLVEIQRVIRKNNSKVKFDPRSMWHSGRVNELGWVSLVVTFPTTVELDRLIVYSEHSGKYHRARHVQIETADNAGQFSKVHSAAISKAKASIPFASTKAKTWKFAFLGKKNGYVVIRGLRFRLGNEEFYPPS